MKLVVKKGDGMTDYGQTLAKYGSIRRPLLPTSHNDAGRSTEEHSVLLQLYWLKGRNRGWGKSRKLDKRHGGKL